LGCLLLGTALSLAWCVIPGRRREELFLLQNLPTKELQLPRWPLHGILRTQSDEQRPRFRFSNVFDERRSRRRHLPWSGDKLPDPEAAILASDHGRFRALLKAETKPEVLTSAEFEKVSEADAFGSLERIFRQPRSVIPTKARAYMQCAVPRPRTWSSSRKSTMRPSFRR
jgi:hypothetical protein